MKVTVSNSFLTSTDIKGKTWPGPVHRTWDHSNEQPP